MENPPSLKKRGRRIWVRTVHLLGAKMMGGIEGHARKWGKRVVPEGKRSELVRKGKGSVRNRPNYPNREKKKRRKEKYFSRPNQSSDRVPKRRKLGLCMQRQKTLVGKILCGGKEDFKKHQRRQHKKKRGMK